MPYIVEQEKVEMAKSKILVGYTFGLTYHILYMCIHPVEEEGEREEGKKGKLSAWFLSKETIQTTAGMAMGGRGSLPGSLSLSIFRV